ncbi:MAG: hypothetical protein IID46_11005, partial [Planctomycetes bacterium]|nr:hypothetical protein [Planctomycetota bacterium]
MQSVQVRRNRRNPLFSKGMLLACGLSVVASLVLVVSSLRGFEESTSADAGLRGLLPSEVPLDLDAEAFSVLDGNWQDWSTETAEKIAALYLDDKLDSTGQRRVIDALKSKLNVMQRALADDRYRLIFDSLIPLHGKLARRVQVAEAALDTLQLDPKSVKKIRTKQARQNVSNAVGKLEQFLKQFQNGEAWLKYVRTNELRRLMAAGDSTDPLLQKVSRKIQDRDSLTDESQRKFLSRTAFTNLAKSVDALIEADSKSVPQGDKQKLRESLASLFRALADYETSSSIVSAANVYAALKDVSQHSLDGGDRINGALKKHYFNHNLRVAASERFLNRFFKEKRTEKGPVKDFILGAHINGTQTTTTIVSLELISQEDGARFAIKADGIVRSNTSGTTDQATIYTDGYHTFSARKEVVFDGKTFTTKPATITVNANNRTVGASTKYNRAPLLGGVARSIAMSVARKKRSQSEAIARGKVSRRVLPKFNDEVDKEFSKAGEELESGITSRLREAGLLPEIRQFSTTEGEFRLNSRTMTPDELGGDEPSFKLDPGDGIVLSFHESVINNALDRMALAGRTLTEPELVKEMEKSISTLLGRDVTLGSSDDQSQTDGKDPDTFMFDANDPIRVQIENGVISLIIRTGLKQKDKQDIPTQIITIPLSLRIEGNQLLVERGTVRVAPVVKP